MDEPLATYEEARFEGRRQFELFPDRIRVVGKLQGIGQFDQTIPLVSLHPTPGRMWVRGRLFAWGVCGLVVGACGVLAQLASGGFAQLLNPTDGLPVMTLVSACVTAVALPTGVVLTLTHLRRVEFTTFRSDAGVIAMDIARAGPRVSEYGDFVGLVTELVAKCRANQLPPAGR